MNCLEKNDYKRSQCLHIFEAYNECKKTWVRTLFRITASPPDPTDRSLPRGGLTGGQAKTPLSYEQQYYQKHRNTVPLQTFSGCPK